MKRSWLFYFSAVAVAAVVSPACTDEGEDDVGTGGSATTGPVTSASSTGQSTTTTSTGSSTGGGGDGGGGGGPSVECLPFGATAAYFDISDASICAVATYTATGLALDGYTGTATWGSHGGPLTGLGSDTMFTVSRWAIPADGTELTVSDASVPVTVQAGAYWSGQVIDVSPTIAVAAWTGTPFGQFGGLVSIRNGAADQEDALGVFAMGVTQGRLLYTGASAAGANSLGTNSLYGASVTMSAITEDGVVDTWGTASGPIAVDALGNVFAFMTDFGAGTQELRAFAAADVGPGDPAVTGVTVTVGDGFGNNIAAITPNGTDPGLVLFQPIDDSTFENLDVVGFTYTIENGTIVPGGAAPTLMLAEDGTNLTLMTDDAGRIWVGALQTGSTTDSVFFVLDRAPR